MDNRLKKIIDEEIIDVQGRWRKNHFKIMVVVCIVMVVVEILMGFVLEQASLIHSTKFTYFIKYIMVPSFGYLLVLLITYLLMKTNEINDKVKNYIVSIGFSLISGIICFIHSYFRMSFSTGAICILLTAVYCDTKLTSYTTLVTVALEGIIGITGNWDPSFDKNVEYYMNILMSVFLLGGVYLSTLAIINNETGLRKTIIKRQGAMQLLKEQVMNDPLTGLYNRLALRKFIDDVTDDVYFAMIDIDHFKLVNDIWGHSKGDEILKRVGKLMKDNYQNYRHDFRFGGDEFLLAFVGINEENVVLECERLKRKFDESLDFEIKMKNVSLSIGVAEYDHNIKPSTAIKRADTALYQAKKSNSKKVYIYSESEK